MITCLLQPLNQSDVDSIIDLDFWKQQLWLRQPYLELHQETLITACRLEAANQIFSDSADLTDADITCSSRRLASQHVLACSK